MSKELNIYRIWQKDHNTGWDWLADVDSIKEAEEIIIDKLENDKLNNYTRHDYRISEEKYSSEQEYELYSRTIIEYEIFPEYNSNLCFVSETMKN